MTPRRSCEILGSKNVKKRKLFHFEIVTPFRLRMKKCSVSGTGNLGQVGQRWGSIQPGPISFTIVYFDDRIVHLVKTSSIVSLRVELAE